MSEKARSLSLAVFLLFELPLVVELLVIVHTINELVRVVQNRGCPFHRRFLSKTGMEVRTHFGLFSLSGVSIVDDLQYFFPI